MADALGKIVLSLAGNDKNGLFVVLKVESEYVYYADGRKRKATNPKRKNIKHIKVLGSCFADVSKATNSMLRKVTAAEKMCR